MAKLPRGTSLDYVLSQYGKPKEENYLKNDVAVLRYGSSSKKVSLYFQHNELFITKMNAELFHDLTAYYTLGVITQDELNTYWNMSVQQNQALHSQYMRTSQMMKTLQDQRYQRQQLQNQKKALRLQEQQLNLQRSQQPQLTYPSQPESYTIKGKNGTPIGTIEKR